MIALLSAYRNVIKVKKKPLIIVNFFHKCDNATEFGKPRRIYLNISFI